MPIIHIELMEGRPVDKIQSLIASVTETVSKELDAPKERIRVLVTELPKSHWGIAGVPASELKNR